MYHPGMARRPKNFTIECVNVTPSDPTPRIRNSPTTVVPASFRATIHIEDPRVVAEVVVCVATGGQANITGLKIEVDVRQPITTSLLRRVLVDPLLRTAIAAASTPIADHDEAKYQSCFRITDKVLTAAGIHREATASGSRAPVAAVSMLMKVSRVHASRYVATARQAGLLPATGRSRGW